MKVTIGHQTQFRLIFAGTFGVGKTTALRAISEIEVVDTDVQSSEISEAQFQAGKKTTTVGFDYGELTLEDSTKIALYGLPGQERFNQMWEMLLSGNVGVILWLYGDVEGALEECKSWLDILYQHQATRFLTVVVTRLPQPTPNHLLQPFRDFVKHYNPYAPVISADPRNRNQVIQAVLMSIGNPDFITHPSHPI